MLVGDGGRLRTRGGAGGEAWEQESGQACRSVYNKLQAGGEARVMRVGRGGDAESDGGEVTKREDREDGGEN